MTNGVFVFLGPTLDVERARAILDATYLPPVRMGDVYRLVDQNRPRAIAIIDGLFDKVPSVWHKEILFALSNGVRVFGSSSMGALRAAELAAFGMEGIGDIYEAYRTGEIEDDDEVAVAHAMADGGYRVMSEALVNIKDVLRKARARGIIASATEHRLEREAKALFYAERSWPLVLKAGASKGVPSDEIARLRTFIEQTDPNLKRDDALKLLAHVAEEVAAGLHPHVPSFDFEPTIFWQKLVNTMSRPAAQTSNGSVRNEEVRRHVQVSLERDDVMRGALLLHLAELEAERLQIEIDAADLARASDRFRRRHALQARERTEAWMKENDLSLASFTRLVRREARIEALCRYYAGPVDALLVDELKRMGTFTATVEFLSEKKEILRRQGISNPTVEDVGVGLKALVDWYQDHVRPIDEDLVEHARRLRFTTPKDFIAELAGLYLIEQARAGGDGAP